MALRDATDDDWSAVTGQMPPQEWKGYVDASDWLIEGLGAIYLGNDDRWWITFARVPVVKKTKTAHVCALRLMRHAREHGIVLHAIADPNKDGSEVWVERLGMVRSDEQLGGLTVWRTP